MLKFLIFFICFITVMISILFIIVHDRAVMWESWDKRDAMEVRAESCKSFNGSYEHEKYLTGYYNTIIPKDPHTLQAVKDKIRECGL